MTIDKEGWGGVQISANPRKTKERIVFNKKGDIVRVDTLETAEMTKAERFKVMQNERAKRLGLRPKE